MQSFKEHFKLLCEKLSIERFRKIRKAFNRYSKKKGMEKLKPGTFGFDIEFNYMKYPSDEELLKILSRKYDIEEKYIDWLVNNHNYGRYASIEDWEEDYPQPEFELLKPIETDYSSIEEYDEAVGEWEYAKEEFDTEYSDWLSSKEDAIESIKEDKRTYTREVFEFYEDDAEFRDYVNSNSESTTDAILDRISRILGKLGECTTDARQDEESDYENCWHLSIDSTLGNPPEISSRILTTKDIPLVRRALGIMSNFNTSANTSAHVHVGIPDDFDGFSLLVAADLMDRHYYEKMMPNRKFAEYSKFSDELIRQLYVMYFKNPEHLMDRAIYYHKNDENGYIGKKEHFGENGKEIGTLENGVIVIPEDNFNELLKSLSNKFHGVNYVNMFKEENKTLEFRFLSSEILSGNKGITDFINFINYYCIVPKIAMRANRLKTSYATFIRQNGNIKVFPKQFWNDK